MIDTLIVNPHAEGRGSHFKDEGLRFLGAMDGVQEVADSFKLSIVCHNIRDTDYVSTFALNMVVARLRVVNFR